MKTVLVCLLFVAGALADPDCCFGDKSSPLYCSDCPENVCKDEVSGLAGTVYHEGSYFEDGECYWCKDCGDGKCDCQHTVDCDDTCHSSGASSAGLSALVALVVAFACA